MNANKKRTIIIRNKINRKVKGGKTKTFQTKTVTTTIQKKHKNGNRSDKEGKDDITTKTKVSKNSHVDKNGHNGKKEDGDGSSGKNLISLDEAIQEETESNTKLLHSENETLNTYALVKVYKLQYSTNLKKLKFCQTKNNNKLERLEKSYIDSVQAVKADKSKEKADRCYISTLKKDEKSINSIDYFLEACGLGKITYADYKHLLKNMKDQKTYVEHMLNSKMRGVLQYAGCEADSSARIAETNQSFQLCLKANCNTIKTKKD